MLQHKGSRTQASLLIDWTPPRVWMEALEARTLLSVDLTADTEVREGYFRYWGSGSVVERNTGVTLWGDVKGYSGAIATFWGDVPEVTRVFVGVRPVDSSDEAFKPRWSAATIIDVPGPMFEVHATLVASTDLIDQPLAADIAFIDDNNGQNTVRRFSAQMLFTDHQFITTAEMDSEAWVERDGNEVQIEVMRFYDRDERYDAAYSVDIDWRDGSPMETHRVDTWRSGSVYLQVDHAYRAGTSPLVTVWNIERTESFSVTPELHLPTITPPRETAKLDEERDVASDWKLNVGVSIRAGEPVTSLGEIWTAEEWHRDITVQVLWDREYEEIADDALLKSLGLKTDPATGRVWHAYSIEIAPRTLSPGHYYLTVIVQRDAQTLGYNTLASVTVEPSTLSYLNGFTVAPEDPVSLWLNEGVRDNDASVFLMDAGSHAANEYRGWFEFSDGTRAPAAVGDVGLVDGYSQFSVSPNFALWSSNKKPIAALPWDEKFNYTGQYEPFAVTLHVERDGASMSLPMELRLGAGWDWMVPNAYDTLAALGLSSDEPLDPIDPTPVTEKPTVPSKEPTTRDEESESAENNAELDDHEFEGIAFASNSKADERTNSVWSRNFFVQEKRDDSDSTLIELIG